MCFQELNVVDHDKIYYAPFRKNFYVEVPEIANMTPAGKTILLTCRRKKIKYVQWIYFAVMLSIHSSCDFVVLRHA